MNSWWSGLDELCAPVRRRRRRSRSAAPGDESVGRSARSATSTGSTPGSARTATSAPPVGGARSGLGRQRAGGGPAGSARPLPRARPRRASAHADRRPSSPRRRLHATPPRCSRRASPAGSAACCSSAACGSSSRQPGHAFRRGIAVDRRDAGRTVRAGRGGRAERVGGVTGSGSAGCSPSAAATSRSPRRRPSKLEELHWTDGVGVWDYRAALHYVRTTPDGRIAFGVGGMQPGLARRIGPRFAWDERAVRIAAEDLHRMFPTFADVPIEAAWGGPIDVAGHHLPFFGSLERGNVHYGLGYTGNGVARPSGRADPRDPGAREGRATSCGSRSSPNDRCDSHRSRSVRPGAFVANQAIWRKDNSRIAGRSPARSSTSSRTCRAGSATTSARKDRGLRSRTARTPARRAARGWPPPTPRPR